MFDNAAKDISDYLVLGMHHTTKESREEITKIINRTVKEEFSKMTPSEIAIAVDKIKRENNYEI